jgi:tetratricopeptide (TPR) repeat protein
MWLTMDSEAVLARVNRLILTKTGKRLSDLQRTILQKVWQGQTYLEIALNYGCTEGHVKDVSAELWQFLSTHLGEKITKRNCRSALAHYLKSIPFSEVSAPPLPNNSRFVGRTLALDHLNDLVNQGVKAIVIQGEGGLGKTTLAQHYLQHHGFELVLELLMAKETPNIASAERVLEEWLHQDLGQEPSVEFAINLSRLRRQLQTRKIGVLIDNLEPALDRQGRFIAAHRNYVELLRVLSDVGVQSVTVITSRDRLCESSLNLTHYRLPGLDFQAWQQFFQNWQIAIVPTILEKMHGAYGGNAKAMEMLCGVIQADFDSDMAAYWQETDGDLLTTTDLKDLVASQVNRLQVLDPQTYRLFCRLGCYRYQDMPTIPTQGLMSLLWDVPAEQHRQTIASLRNRSLVEYHNGGYWLHPVIRAEAIARLRASDDWETANRQAAEFWTTSVPTIATTKDALQALEAYYHYVAIEDFASAGRVILKSRDNQWQQFLPLGSTLYRMGLLQPLLTAIPHILTSIQSFDNLSELCNILGDLRWITGNIHEAIICQEQAIALASQSLKSLSIQPENKHQHYYLKMLKVDSLLSMGLYKIDLWELEAASQLFQQVITLAQNTPHHRWAEKASVCLALTHSHLGLEAEAYTLADTIYQSLFMQQLGHQRGKFAYFMQILGQTYVNLGDFEKANQLFQETLTFAEVAHYTQIEAKTLNGLAKIHRQQADFATALTYHAEAIARLDKIGAKCDLAEVCFQQGLTYQAMQNSNHSQACFEAAIALFTQMQAPNQVAKVKQHLPLSP